MVQTHALWEAFVGLSMVCGCVSDLATRRLPNPLCTAIWAGGLLQALCARGSLGLCEALLASLTAGLIFLLPYLPGWVAAGDVKFFAALATFLTPDAVVPAALAATTFGGVLGIGVMLADAGARLASSRERRVGLWFWLQAARQQGWFSLCSTCSLAGAPPRPRPTVPYAIALACGVWLARAFPAR